METIHTQYKRTRPELQEQLFDWLTTHYRAERERNRRVRAEGRKLAKKLTGMPDLFDLSVVRVVREMDEEMAVARLRRVAMA